MLPQIVIPYIIAKFGLLKKILLIALLSGGLFCKGQNFVKGVVTDSTGLPVPYCAMALLNAKDSSLVKGNVADDKGEFLYEKVATGNYILKFSNVGFKQGWSQPFAVDSLSQISIPAQIMKPEGVVLKEITVAAFKPTIEFKNGMVVMNIENNIISGGNTIFELLKRVPGVTIDAQNNISVNGRGGVRFLIDGRLQQIPTGQMVNMLMGMPAESVSYIELIKNPPAKYDAAGTGGLINIVMKKAKVKGFSGSLSQSGSHGDQWRGGTFGSFNYKSNKLTLFSNFNFSYLQFQTVNYFERRNTDSTGTLGMYSYGLQLPRRFIVYLTGGAEYELSKKTVLGFNYTYNKGTNHNIGNNWLNINEGNYFPYNRIHFFTDQNEDVITPSLNFNITHKFDSLTRLQVSVDYTNYREVSGRYTENHYQVNNGSEVLPMLGINTSLNTNLGIATQKLDLTRDFKNAWSLETGFKSSFVTNRSNSVFQRTDTSGTLSTDPAYSYGYQYNERILAGYLTLGKNFKKLNIRAGVRSEHTLIDANDNPKPFTLHRDYLNFFPSGSIDYKLNEKNNLQANYSYRIDRPGYDQMNPVRSFFDQFALGAGNPYLKPQYSHNMNLDYSFNNVLTLSASAQLMNNMIYYYSYGDKNKVNIDTVFNYPHRNNFTLSAFAQKQVKWFNFQVYAMGMYRTFAGSVNGITSNSETFQLYGNTTLEFLLPKNFKIQLQGYYGSRFHDGVQVYYPRGVCNFTIFKSFFNKKLDISFSVFDVFYSDFAPNTNQVGAQYSYYVEKNDTRRLRGFIVWKFGKMRINRSIKRDNDDQSNRLKKVG